MFHGTIAAIDADGFFADLHVGAEEAGAASPARDAARARSQNARIIIAGRPTWARWAKLIGAPISAVMVSAISARRWS